VKSYILSTSKIGTIGLDTEVNLRLEITCEKAPERLSDFVGGSAELCDGYSTHTVRFTICAANFDHRRICLTNAIHKEFVIDPEFTRRTPIDDPMAQLTEVPLKLGQNLSEYVVRNSNWGLK
jgi:hypothetical protein